MPTAPRALATIGALAGLTLLAACERGATEPRLPSFATRNPNPQVGDVIRLNTRIGGPEVACDTITSAFRTGRVAAVSERAVIVADQANPANGFSDAEYQQFGAAFDTLAYRVNEANFGTPTDIDGNGRSIIFFTSAVNAQTPRSAPFIIGGFFWERDLFPRTGNGFCRGSNEGEMFYMLVPDPTGAVNGNVRTKDYVNRVTVSTLAHELQHLVNSSRRFYVTRTDVREERWMDEGLSHVAEELTFYRAAVLTPRRNLSIGDLRASSTVLSLFNQHQVANHGRLATYLQQIERASPYADNDSLSTRGATWDFLRYALDRAVAAGGNETQILQRLVNTNTKGMANLQQAFGAAVPLRDWFRDWTVAHVADDLAAASDVRFTKPSWNNRSILPALSSSNTSTYPLQQRTLIEGLPARLDTLPGGGAAYVRFAVPAGGSATVRTRALGGGALPGAMRLSVVRLNGDAANETPTAAPITTFEQGQGADLTVAGNASGPAQYTLVLFHADTNPAARVSLQVTGTGLTAPTLLASAGPAGEGSGASGTATMQAGPTLARLGAAAELPVTDAPMRAQFERAWRQALAARVPAARAWYAAGRGRPAAPQERQ